MDKSNHRDNNLFHRVIWNETNFTDLFCNFLSYKLFRDKFIELVNEKIGEEGNTLNVKEIAYENFETEIDLEGNGRADLFLELDTGEKVIFEVKIKRYTSLTDKQPDGYRQYLEKDEHSCVDNLFFIIPKFYQHENNIRAHKIIYWEEIIKLIEREGLHKLNPFMGEFHHFCKEWFEMKVITFEFWERGYLDSERFKKDMKDEEILQMAINDANLPKVMVKINEMVDQISESVNLVLKKNESFSAYWYGYKTTFEDSKGAMYDLWMGVDYEIWEKYNLPICLVVIADKEQGEPDLVDIEIEKVEIDQDNPTYIIKFEEKITDANFISSMIEKINILQKIKEI